MEAILWTNQLPTARQQVSVGKILKFCDLMNPRCHLACVYPLDFCVYAASVHAVHQLLGGGLGGWWDLDDAYLHSTISWERTCPLAQRLTPPVHSAKPISKPTATVPVLFQWYILSTNDQVQTFETRCSISLIRNPMWLPQEYLIGTFEIQTTY
ncbi:hypothetical protein CHUAL_013626 [Chamberlinius hualienensis]